MFITKRFYYGLAFSWDELL